MLKKSVLPILLSLILASSMFPFKSFASSADLSFDDANLYLDDLGDNFCKDEFYIETSQNLVEDCVNILNIASDIDRSDLQIDNLEKIDNGVYSINLDSDKVDEKDIYANTIDIVGDKANVIPVKKFTADKTDPATLSGDVKKVIGDRFSIGSGVEGERIRNLAGKTNETQYVAVLDGGFNVDHKELKGKFATEYAYLADVGKNGVYKDADDHGTGVSSCIAGIKGNGLISYGVCPDNVKIIPISVNTKGKSDSISETSIIKALRYVENLIVKKKLNNLRVVNMSFGGFYTNSEIKNYKLCTTGDPLYNQINRLYNKYGVVCVCSGGNGGYKNNKNGRQLPSDYSKCVAVTACYDGAYCDFSEVNAYKDITAPGFHIPVASAKSNKASEYVSGTSISSPIIAGELANMFLLNPNMSANKAVSVLKSSCVKLSKQNSNYSKDNGSKGVPNMDTVVKSLLKNKDYWVGFTDYCKYNNIRYGFRIISSDQYDKRVELTIIDRTSNNIKNLTIPSKVKLHDGNTYRVTQIAKNAKAYIYGDINNITIGSNIKNIKGTGFYITKGISGSRTVDTLTIKSKYLDKNDFKKVGFGAGISKINKIAVSVSLDYLENRKYIKKYKSFLNKKYLRCNVGKLVAY